MHNKKLEKIKELRLMDDTLMAIALGGCKEAIQLILRIVLDQDDITIVECSGQYEIKNPAMHEVRFDIYAKDDRGICYDLEVQRADQGAIAKRLRYHAGELDSILLPPRTDYSLLPETYVIFITENDVRGEGLPRYVFERFDTKSHKPLGDNQHLVFINNKYDEDDPLGELMRDLREPDPDRIHNPILAERVRYIKCTKKGVVNMCRMMEEERNEGMLEAKRAIIVRLWKKGNHDIPDLAETIDCSNDVVYETLRSAGLL